MGGTWFDGWIPTERMYVFSLLEPGTLLSLPVLSVPNF
jgi:hypothetical protein